MTKRKHRTDNVMVVLKGYAKSRTIGLLTFSDIHTRLTDDYTVVDIWPTTGKYWVGKTSYHEMTDKRIQERGGEKGTIPVGADAIYDYLDKLFFAADM